MEETKREIAVMKKLKHPNLINLYEVIYDQQNEYLYYVMEYLD